MIPCGWLDVQQVEKTEQHAAMTRVNRPEKRQIVAAMPGGDGVASGGQFGGAALFRKHPAHLAAKILVGLFRRVGAQHLMQGADQPFLGSPVLVLQVFGFLLRRGLGLQYAAEHHLGQLITASHHGPADERQQQGVALPRFADSQRSLTSSTAASDANGRSLV